MNDREMTIRYDPDEIADGPRDLPTLALSPDGSAAVAAPEIPLADGALLAPEAAVALGLEYVRLGRILQAAERGEIVGRILR